MEGLSSPQTVRDGDWKILIIDDDEDDYVIIREMLAEAKGRKCDVQWAPGYKAGRTRLFANLFDAVLVDYDMGLHSGIELIREANERGYPAPLILFTGRGSYDVDMEAMQAGATLYLTKNEANPLLLERGIRYAIERKQSEEALRRARDEAQEQQNALRQRNEWLRQSEEKFARAFQYNPAAMAITRIADARYTDANESFCRMIGYCREAVLGHASVELGLFTQAVREGILDGFRRQGHVHQQELPIVTQDGSQRHVLFSLDPIEVGGEPSIIATMIDITERKQAEQRLQCHQQELEAERARLEAVLEGLPVGVWIADENGRVVGKNKQADRIWAGGAPLVTGIDQYWEYETWDINDHRLEAEDYPLAIVLRSGQPFEPAEYRIRRFDGSTGYVLISVTPINDGEGQMIGAVVINLDISGRKANEAALQEREAALRESNVELRKTTEALRKSEEKFARSFRASPIAISITTIADGRFIEVNDSCTDLFGYTRQDLLGHTSVEIGLYATPAEREEVARLFRTGNGFRNVELCMHKKSGEPRDVLYSAEPIEVDGQECMLSLVVDITERKAAELTLRETNDRFRAALASAPISVYTTDCDLRLTWIYDYHPHFNPEAVIGLRLDEVMPGLYSQRLVEIQRAVIETGQAQQGEIETWVDGQQSFYTYYIDPIRAEDATINGVACAGYDITERKQAEAALKANAEALKANAETLKANTETLKANTEALIKNEAALKQSIDRERARAAELETLMDTVPAMIWIARDPECREMTGNRYGYEFLHMWQGANISKTAGEKDVSLQPYRNFKNGQEVPTAELPMQRAAATGEASSNYEFDLIFNDGTARTILGNVNPLFDEHGQPSGSVAAFMDITGRREVEKQLQHYTEALKHYSQELERSNQALQDFAFIASHDLQEPLRKIIMFGSSLEKQLGEMKDELADEYLNRMKNAAERMQTMINGLLELSRVNTRGAQFTPVHLTELVEEVVSDLEAALRAVEGRVQIESLPAIDADALQMRQLFQNLIGNAIKFHKRDLPPRVRVTGQLVNSDHGSKKPLMAEIRVEDNGIGFEPHEANRIFQPFQRLHGRSEYEGTGLGLAICQKIVERHHGEIEVVSQPGVGSVFIVRMPVKAR